MNFKHVMVRCVSIVLMVFCILFAVTWPDGSCFGDLFLTDVGLKAWSHGIYGTHYTALYSLGALLGASALYAMTTENRLKTFRRLLLALTALLFLTNALP